jgi:hypothetical protein
MKGLRVPDAKEDLKATAADLAADAERLKQVEQQKARLDPGDPRLEELAAEADAIAQELPVKTAAQSELVRELSGGD